MCVVSMVGDHYRDRWTTPQPSYQIAPSWIVPVSREEFNRPKAEVEEMKKALEAAKFIDKVTGQPDCENEDKLKVLREVAKLVGVELNI